MNQKEFHLKNAIEAREFWKTVPPTGVCSRLKRFNGSCGTTHCFGGWLPYSDYFKGIGVQATEEGIIEFVQGERINCGFQVAHELFGWDGMFNIRYPEEEKALVNLGLITDRRVTDHEFVAARIERLILELRKELEPRELYLLLG